MDLTDPTVRGLSEDTEEARQHYRRALMEESATIEDGTILLFDQ
jgi:hypothetical protein